MATEKAVVDTIHLEAHGETHRLQNVGLRDAHLAIAALEGAAQEHSMGVFEAFKTYKRAAFWSICECHNARECVLSFETDYCSNFDHRCHGGI